MRLVALAAALLVVLAGCGGVLTAPATDTTGTDAPSPTPSTDVQVIGGDLPFDATTVFERVLNVTDERVPGPVVYVEDADEESPAVLESRDSQFRQALGIVPPRNDSEGVHLAAYAPADGNSVHVYESVLENETTAESTVAHEFVHVVQFQNEWHESIWTVDPAVGSGEISYDGELTYYLVLEGAAAYVQYRYEQEFLPSLPDGAAAVRAAYENASAYERLSIARYVYGAEYVAERADSPADLRDVHRRPPESSEQVLHNTTDPVEDVTVTTGETGNWTVDHRDRQGELFLRVALRTELNRSTAVDAAAGWGEDRRVTFERGNATGTAWVLHWDDRANATMFEAAFERYLDAKATERDGVWYQDGGNATYRLERTSNEMSVVLLGNESFVRGVSLESTHENAVEVNIARTG